MRRSLLALPLLLAACGQSSDVPVVDVDDARFDGLNNPPAIVSGPNGVYIVARDGTVWWLNGAKAERVVFPK